MSNCPGKYDVNIETELPTSVYEFEANIPEIMPVSSNVIYATNKINGIKMTTIASKIDNDSNFSFDWILRATGLTP